VICGTLFRFGPLHASRAAAAPAEAAMQHAATARAA
jgi:hypothetical protein